MICEKCGYPIGEHLTDFRLENMGDSVLIPMICPVTVVEAREEVKLLGKPSKGTPADKRLKENKPAKPKK